MVASARVPQSTYAGSEIHLDLIINYLHKTKLSFVSHMADTLDIVMSHPSIKQ
jgi:hypothetical protein